MESSQKDSPSFWFLQFCKLNTTHQGVCQCSHPSIETQFSDLIKTSLTKLTNQNLWETFVYHQIAVMGKLVSNRKAASVRKRISESPSLKEEEVG